MTTAPLYSPLDGEVHADQIIMCLKDGLRANRHMCSVYHPIKAAVRNRTAFWTQAEDENAQREEKYDRQRKALRYGFFTEKTKPFKTLGTVHLDDGDLILSALTDDIKARMIDLPKLKKDSLEKSRKIRMMNRRPTPTITPAQQQSTRSSVGIHALKQRISEVVEMKKLVFGEQTLSGYLRKKEAEINKSKEPEPGKMLAPPNQNWAVVTGAIPEVAAVQKSTTEDASLAAKAVIYFQQIADKKKLKLLSEQLANNEENAREKIS